MKSKDIEVFYTGGGIWLAGMYTSNNIYYIVDSEFTDCLTCYNHENEDDDTDYPCQDMVFSKEISELTDYEKTIYNDLLTELKNKMW